MKHRFVCAIALGLSLATTTAAKADLSLALACDPLYNYMLTSQGRCLNLDRLASGEAPPVAAPQAGLGQWEVGETAIAYQGDQGTRRVTITLRNNGTTEAAPFAVRYRITSEGQELYQGSILKPSPLAPGGQGTIQTLVGPGSLRGTQIGGLRVEVTEIID